MITSRSLKTLGAVALALTLLATMGCIQTSGGTWRFRSAPTPEDWPEATPIGAVQLRTYPAYRAALVEDASLQQSDRGGMFMELFRHIQRNEIAMTAPVEMVYRPGAPEQLDSMAFLYRTQESGEVGDEGAVRVRDLQPATYASVGVRGDYSRATYERGLEQLEAWIADNDAWEVDGPPRFLGYNSPFVLWFLRYGEVQIPLRARVTS